MKKVVEEINNDENTPQHSTTNNDNSTKRQKRVTFKMSVNLNNYEKVKKVGEGSFGKVYLIEDKDTEKQYCAKISRNIIEDNSLDDLINLITEVSLFSKFEHPSIIKFIGYSTVDFNNNPKPVIIMECCPNGTLKDAISKEKYSQALPGYDDTIKLIIIYGIASAMSYLHSHDILHRDLKTDNVLLDAYLYPKIADFGLAAIMSNLKEKESNTCGTPIYMAPEIIKDQNYTKAGDVYSFSLIVYGIIESCWQQDPNKRLKFDDILNLLETDDGFITNTIDKNDYLNYINYIKSSQINFDTSKPQIPIRYKMSNSQDSQLTNDLQKSGINNEKQLYEYARKNRGLSMGGGKFVPKSFDEIKKSADEGNENDYYQCGQMLYEGNGVKMNKELAAYYFKKGTDCYDFKCMYKYAKMLLKGEGVQKNLEESLHYYKTLADINEQKGPYKYAKLLLNKNLPCFNKDEGLYYLDLAVRLNYVKAALKFGHIYYNGEFDVPIDKEKAFKYFKIAANKNSVDAVMMVALMLMNGVGTQVDKNAAISLFRDYAGVKAIAMENYFKLLNEGVPDSNDRYSIQLDESTNDLMKCDPSVYQKQNECLNQIKQKQSQVQQPKERTVQSSECCLLI